MTTDAVIERVLNFQEDPLKTHAALKDAKGKGKVMLKQGAEGPFHSQLIPQNRLVQWVHIDSHCDCL
jgi:hypothetical protein